MIEYNIINTKQDNNVKTDSEFVKEVQRETIELATESGILVQFQKGRDQTRIDGHESLQLLHDRRERDRKTLHW